MSPSVSPICRFLVFALLLFASASQAAAPPAARGARLPKIPVPFRTIACENRAPWTVALSAKATHLALFEDSGKSKPGRLSVYLVKTGKRLWCLDLPLGGRPGRLMSFSPDGETLIFATALRGGI